MSQSFLFFIWSNFDIFSDVVAALRFLLMGTADAAAAADAELLARTPQELYELVLLIR